MNTNSFETGPRAFLPRWHPSSLSPSTVSGESRAFASSALTDSFNDLLKEWNEENNLSNAEELVAYGLATGRTDNEDVKEAAKLLTVSKRGRLSERHAHIILGESEHRSDALSIREGVSSARERIRMYPSSAIVWADYAYYRCLAGAKKKARDAIMTAASLSSESPLVAMPASRCLVHLGEPDVALQIVRKALKASRQPRLLCTEMALTQILGKSSKHFHDALKLHSEGGMADGDRAALGAGLATELTIHGAERRAKKILGTNYDPQDENTLAQVVWLQDRLNIDLEIDADLFGKSHEACARVAFADKDYKKCVSSIELWSEFQPFSISAICFGSYVASMFFCDHKKSLKLLEKGTLIGKDNFSIWNNFAFDYAKLNMMEDAQRAIGKAVKLANEEDKIGVLSATRGLVAMRCGQFEFGRKLYKDAVTHFRSKGDRRNSAIATLMWAEEEANSGSESFIQLIEEAETSAKEGNHPRVLDAISTMKKSLRKLSE